MSRHMSIVSLFATGLFGSAIFSTGVAAQQQNCDAVLLPERLDSRVSRNKVLAYASLHSADLYEKIRNARSSGASAGGAYGIYKAEFDSSSSASEFSEKIRRRLDSEGFSSDEREARTILRESLSADQIKAWTKCKGGGGGLSIPTTTDSRKAITARVRWRAPQGLRPPFKFKATLSGPFHFSDPKNKVKTLNLEHSHDKDLVIVREDCSASGTLVVEGRGLSQTITLPKGCQLSWCRPDVSGNQYAFVREFHHVYKDPQNHRVADKRDPLAQGTYSVPNWDFIEKNLGGTAYISTIEVAGKCFLRSFRGRTATLSNNPESIYVEFVKRHISTTDRTTGEHRKMFNIATNYPVSMIDKRKKKHAKKDPPTKPHNFTTWIVVEAARVKK